MTQTISEKSFLTVLSLSLATVFIWSAIDPHDRVTWFLEVLPVIAAVIVLLVTYHVFRFTRLAPLIGEWRDIPSKRVNRTYIEPQGLEWRQICAAVCAGRLGRFPQTFACLVWCWWCFFRKLASVGVEGHRSPSASVSWTDALRLLPPRERR